MQKNYIHNEKINKLIHEDRIKGEIQINIFRIVFLIFAFIFLILLVLNIKTFSITYKLDAVFILIGILYSLFFISLLKKKKYYKFLTYFSSLFDVSLIIFSILMGIHAYGSSYATLSIGFNVFILFADITVTIRRHNYKNTLFTGFLASFSYLITVIIMYKHGVFSPIFTTSSNNLIVRFDIVNEITKVLIIFIVSLICAYISKNFDTIFYKGIITQIEKENIKSAFGQYLSKEIVEKVLKKEILLKIINIYFSYLIDIVTKNKGYINKFLGDGVLIFFGAPVEIKNYQNYAVNEALEISKTIPKIDKKIQTLLKNYDVNWHLDIGIGINTGKVVLGNVGSENKIEYTALGDSVNVASRLERLTRKLNKRIIIEKNTINDFVSKFIEKKFIVKLKDKTNYLTVYSLKSIN